MKITVTAREILDAPLIGSWDKFCTSYGIWEWAINEGVMEESQEFEITEEEAREWGLLK